MKREAKRNRMNRIDLEKPMISVIIPVYNGAPYIGKCLDSVGAQTYPNIEIIVVDDGSTDDSGRICDTRLLKEERLHVIHFLVNRGPSAARNEGIRTAKGTYVAFVDADDYVEPDLLEKLYCSLLENGADMSACGADGLKLKEGPAGVYSGAEAVCCLAKGGPFNHVPWGKLYRTEFVEQYFFDETVFYGEDLLFLYQILKKANRVSYIPDILYHYVSREGSQVQSGINERKCTALPVNDFVCEDAAVSFPEAVEGFRQWALETNRCLAVLAARKGILGEGVFKYLKRLQRNTRRHFSWKALALCPEKKWVLTVLLLYMNAGAFWAVTRTCQEIKRLWSR